MTTHVDENNTGHATVDRTAGRPADGPDAARIAASVAAVPGVLGLHGGWFSEFATFGPHQRVAGVRVRDDHVTVAVTVRYPMVAADIAAAVRAALPDVGVPVHIVIADIEVTPRSRSSSSTVDISHEREETS